MVTRCGWEGNGSDVNVTSRRACGGTYRSYCVRGLQGKDEEEKMASRLTRQSLQSSPDWWRKNLYAGHGWQHVGFVWQILVAQLVETQKAGRS